MLPRGPVEAERADLEEPNRTPDTASILASQSMASATSLIILGRNLIRQWRLEAALTALDSAVRLNPASPAAHYLKGEALFLQRRFTEALDSHDAAVRCGINDDPEIRADSMSWVIPGDFGWMSHMLCGDFERAWQRSDRDRAERRAGGVTGAAWPRHLRPVWDGSALDGRRILVRCFHGLGDTIQFIRYVPLLARRGATVVVEAQPALLPLLSEIDEIARLHPLPEDCDIAGSDYGCDVEVEITELPYAFRTVLTTIPTAVPYLRADPDRVAALRPRLPPKRQLAVGLVWAAGEWKPERSLPIGDLFGWGAIPEIALFCLQRGPEFARWRAVRKPAMSEALASDDIGDAAAAIMNLDLVVTVDTMVAHLAGALGRPVWLLLHYAADWRWLLDRADSPWYPTMRLFRQPRPGDWGSVVAAVTAALRRPVASRFGCNSP
ncbi:MAG: tetratricopeptide repeat protein [Alphaproteobacteria bacterium]|nr:tetratricopeptide repeat protein [Alphaproteobacteria bacterium]